MPFYVTVPVPPYQLGKAEELFSDITFTGNDDFPYLLNVVIFTKEPLCYQAVSRVLCDNQDGSPMVCLSIKYSNKPRNQPKP